MSWKPSEGHKRAEDVVVALEEDALATNGHAIWGPLFRHRMVAVIGGALDQALADGAGHGALAAVADPVQTSIHTTTGIGFNEAAEDYIATTNGGAALSPAPVPKRGRPKGTGAKRGRKPKVIPTVESMD